MRRTDTAVVFPQPHPDSTSTAAATAGLKKGKAKKLRTKGRGLNGRCPTMTIQAQVHVPLWLLRVGIPFAAMNADKWRFQGRGGKKKGLLAKSLALSRGGICHQTAAAARPAGRKVEGGRTRLMVGRGKRPTPLRSAPLFIPHCFWRSVAVGRSPSSPSCAPSSHSACWWAPFRRHPPTSAGKHSWRCQKYARSKEWLGRRGNRRHATALNVES